MTMQNDAPVSSEATTYTNKLFPCTKPCDSFGVCDGCCERTIFLAGYNFGYRAAHPNDSKIARYEMALEIIAKSSLSRQLVAIASLALRKEP